jgi:hypothetical protein
MEQSFRSTTTSNEITGHRHRSRTLKLTQQSDADKAGDTLGENSYRADKQTSLLCQDTQDGTGGTEELHHKPKNGRRREEIKLKRSRF